MRGEQCFRGRRFERDAALGADDGVAEVDAAPDAETRAQRFELLEQCYRVEGLAVEGRKA